MLKSCSVYPYQVIKQDDGSEVIQYLLRKIETDDGRAELKDFGDIVDPLDRDYSIFYTAARSFYSLTGTLIRTTHSSSTESHELESVLAGFLKQQNFDYFMSNPQLYQDFI